MLLLHRDSLLGHPCHPTNEDDFINLTRLNLSIFQGLLARLLSLLDQSLGQFLKLSPSQLSVDVLGARSISRNKRKINFGLDGGRKFDLRLFRSFTDALNSHSVLGKVDALLLLELGDYVSEEDDIKIFTTEMGITVGRLDFEDGVLDFKDGDIKGTAAEIVDCDDSISGFVETIGKSRSGGFVDDSENVQSGN